MVVIATTRISVNVEEYVKQDAQRVLGEMGLDMTTAIDSFLRTIVREERIPYELRTERAYKEAVFHSAHVNAELDRSLSEAGDPNVRRVPHEEMVAHLRRQREARAYV